jgi:hypothetical protein
MSSLLCRKRGPSPSYLFTFQICEIVECHRSFAEDLGGPSPGDCGAFFKCEDGTNAARLLNVKMGMNVVVVLPGNAAQILGIMCACIVFEDGIDYRLSCRKVAQILGICGSFTSCEDGNECHRCFAGNAAQILGIVCACIIFEDRNDCRRCFAGNAAKILIIVCALRMNHM